MAAGILIVVLPGLGMVGWKFLAPNRQETQLSSPASSSKKLLVSEGASQVTPARAMVEAKPVSALSETPAVPALNITDLLAALKSKDVAERRQAASALHGAGAEAKEAIPALRAALKDSDEEVQMWAALALVNTQTYDKAIIPILVRALKNDNTVLRQVACLSLGLIPYESGDKGTIVPALTEAAVNDKDEDVRQAAKSALSIVAPEAPESAAVK
jgi:HEAT repeat protein